MKQLLEMQSVTIGYANTQPILQEVSLTVAKGEIVAMVGQSGSGKSTLLRAIIGALPAGGRILSGKIMLSGRDMAELSSTEWRALRGTRLSMIFQDNGAMLNPIRTIGSQFVEYMRAHERSLSKQTAIQRAKKQLEQLCLSEPERILSAYPHQLSGGQRQRVGIAMALTFAPELLLADEPTSALDVTTQSHIITQLRHVCARKGTALLLVTHNIGVAQALANRLIVMKEGHIVEQGQTMEVLQHPQSDDTRMLLESIPKLG